MQPVLNVGVDVAKDTVVVASADQRWPVQQVRNQRTALRAWLKTLPAGSRIGLESTGSYHELLADLAHAHGHTVYLLNPMETRHYAKALGARAKTDRVDATLLARMIAQEHAGLRAYRPPTTEQRQVDRLIRRRAKIVRLKSALKLTMAHLEGLTREVNAVVQKLDALLAKLDATMATVAAQSLPHQQAQQRVETIVGVGPLVGMSLTNTLERVPFRHADAFVAFTGLDPRAKDSGQKSGRRRLSKRGPAELRRLLFNAAMAAVKSKVWKPIYDSYRNQGWSSTASLVIIARKIARAAWSIHRYQTTFNPDRLTRGLT